MPAINESAEQTSTTSTILSRDALSTLNKGQLIEAYLKTAELATTMGEMNSTIKLMSNRLNQMETIINDLIERNEELEQRLVENERLTFSDAQYSRRRLLEISTSTGQFHDSPHLKATVARLMSLTGSPVTAANIDICHTIGKEGKKRVIMEMADRTTRYNILRARKELKNVNDGQFGSIFINESLCDPYKRLDYLCRKLKKSSHVHSTWFWNGRIFIKKTENSDKIHVSHVTDICSRFDRSIIDPLFN